MNIIALIVTMLLIDGTVTSQGYKAPLGTSVEQCQEEAETLRIYLHSTQPVLDVNTHCVILTVPIDKDKKIKKKPKGRGV
tara:strand:+ start:382 stop:621 length:240 start_codon:yes stop_codon:yes gene_type:complete